MQQSLCKMHTLHLVNEKYFKRIAVVVSIFNVNNTRLRLKVSLFECTLEYLKRGAGFVQDLESEEHLEHLLYKFQRKPVIVWSGLRIWNVTRNARKSDFLIFLWGNL